MAGRSKLPHAKEWRERHINDWNTTTFRSYLAEMHEEKYGIPYIAYNLKQEVGMISRLIKEHGKEVTKLFIDICLDEYKPTRQYPSINFGFMYSYMKARNLPRAISEVRRREKEVEERVAIEKSITKESIDEIIDYL